MKPALAALIHLNNPVEDKADNSALSCESQ